jgi:hypothetical protein
MGFIEHHAARRSTSARRRGRRSVQLPVHER